MISLAEVASGVIQRGAAAILVTVRGTLGSTPREVGAAMLVALEDSHGTIGGGRLEYDAIAQARAMIGRADAAQDVQYILGPDLGQCCGGRVILRFEPVDADLVERLTRESAAARDRLPSVFVFGAGHVGKALVRSLGPLPVRVGWIDQRADAFPDPVSGGIEAIIADDPVACVPRAPAGSAFVILTHLHPLDYALAEAALRRGDAAYVGMIGSLTKRARFERSFIGAGGSADQAAGLTCPIGGGIAGEKRPEVIAALTTAEILRAVIKPPTA